MTTAEKTAKIEQLERALAAAEAGIAEAKAGLRTARGAEKRRLFGELDYHTPRARSFRQQLNTLEVTRTVD